MMLLKCFLVVSIISSALCVVNMPFFLSIKKLLGNELFSHLNRSQLICNNIYKYVCDDWKNVNSIKPDYEPYWNQYTLLSYKIHSRLQLMLENKNEQLANEKLFYETCTNRLHENNHLTQLKHVIDKLGGWTRDEFKSWDDYNFLKHVVEVTKLLNVYPILKFHVGINFLNKSQNALYIESGTLIFPQTFLLQPKKYYKQIQIYEQWITKTYRVIYGVAPKESLVKDLMNFEISLANLEIIDDNINKISIENLPDSNKIDWIAILRFLLLNTSANYHSVTHALIKPKYFRSLLLLLNKTSPRTVSNYIIWCAINDLSRETSWKLRKINFEVNKAIFGIIRDVPRQLECVQHVLMYFPNKLAATYAENYFDSEIIKQVHDMSTRIRNQFLSILEHNSWLSEKSKMWAIKKITSVQFEIGFPKTFTEENHVNVTSNHLTNMIKLKNLKYQHNVEALDKLVNEIKWPGHCFQVNAFYSVIQNAIILPMGILSAPFYDTKSSQFLNYGALGTLIGHELAHALDTHKGNKGLTAKDQRFKSIKTNCFNQLYNSYGVDSESTTNENIADHVGMQLAYAALDGSKSGKKLFFLSFVKMWCENSGDGVTVLPDEHAPVEMRVLGTLQNFEPYKLLFGCKNNAGIYNCSMW